MGIYNGQGTPNYDPGALVVIRGADRAATNIYDRNRLPNGAGLDCTSRG
ncbi:protein of unknown function [Candidatus Filomicrobium marinum]|uniref:Uncharacterized protein n=1 Tax=Candidatus Filomicrobium marinum TaxID=1608628 RepID=A0A0D6JE46_9HYPH|nr:protein of unknown function [Candidatus Filomicrobium marinum]CPR18497.1 protein of unknown function [Candidatus Filomicrobium marinum]